MLYAHIPSTCWTIMFHLASYSPRRLVTNLWTIWFSRLNSSVQYCQHLQHTIPETNKTEDREILQGKSDKLIYAKVLLWLGFFVDALSTTKQFSLTPQKADIDIISIIDNVESAKNSYEKLQRKFESQTDKVLMSALF